MRFTLILIAIALLVASLVGGAAYALRPAAPADCCYPGADCCYPGSPCCPDGGCAGCCGADCAGCCGDACASCCAADKAPAKKASCCAAN